MPIQEKFQVKNSFRDSLCNVIWNRSQESSKSIPRPPSGQHHFLKRSTSDSIRYNLIMKTLAEIQKILQEQKPFLADRYGVRIVGVFGSYVRQEQRPDSDLDLLIDLDRPPKISLIGLVELEDYLSQLLGIKVDLAIKTNLKKRIGGPNCVFNF